MKEMTKTEKIIKIFLIVSTAAFVIFLAYDLITRDTKPPVIECGDELTVSVSSTEEELLRDVTAKDKRSGDVSDSLVVEKMSELMENDTRIITYAAIDEQGNVGRKERTIRYSDYEKPRFTLSQPLYISMNDVIDISMFVGAESSLDGQLDYKVKYSVEGNGIAGPGMYQITYSVTDSTGNTVYLPITLEIYDEKESKRLLELKEYLIYLNVNDEFDPYEYYESNRNEKVRVNSEVDTSVPGIYIVSYETENAKSPLIVIVE